MIAAVVIPWRSFQDHPHWARIRWVPFLSSPVGPRDIIGNVLLYVPFGYYACLLSKHRGWLVGIAGAALLSCITEVTQVFGHGRFPSVQDVLMNVLGAAFGVVLSRTRRGKDEQ